MLFNDIMNKYMAANRDKIYTYGKGIKQEIVNFNSWTIKICMANYTDKKVFMNVPKQLFVVFKNRFTK